MKIIGDPKSFCNVSRTAAGAEFSAIWALQRAALGTCRIRNADVPRHCRPGMFGLIYEPSMLPIKEDSAVQVTDPFRPYERLVKIKLMKKTVQVPEKNSLLRCFQFLSPETIPYGRFCWNQDCQYCRVMAKLPDDDKPREMLSCKFMVMPGMEITEISPELKLCLRPILQK
jgi:hypothetical protein